MIMSGDERCRSVMDLTSALHVDNGLSHGTGVFPLGKVPVVPI